MKKHIYNKGSVQFLIVEQLVCSKKLRGFTITNYNLKWILCSFRPFCFVLSKWMLWSVQDFLFK